MEPQDFWQAAHPASSPDVAVTPPQVAESSPAPAAEPEHEQQQVSPEPRIIPDDEFAEIEKQAQRAKELEEVNQKLSGTIQQVQQWAESQVQQQQAQVFKQQFEDREKAIYERAGSMPWDEARAYIQNENQKLRDEINQQWSQRYEQTRRTLATPLYVDHLIQQHGLPAEAKQELMAAGDPDAAARLAPYIKARYDQFSQLNDRINQLSRSQQAAQLQAQGVGMVGGVTNPGTTIPLPDDPDDRAIAILHELQRGAFR